ncbi:MAG: PadR family transcriptional regulator [Bacteroides sp.]|nr:PadR family transcriptional regulator [Bacteroides sp.]MDE7441418.1 PadR family transcriptional regulator [Muribaculaceae bacterium]
MEEKTANIKSQMRKGMLEYCILLVLKEDRKYTSDIIDRMRKSGLVVVEGTLYTLLNRLRKEGKLTYEWEESPKGPPRKYYRLTPFGSEVLQYMSEAWDEIASTVDSLRSADESNESKTINLEKQNENNL